MQNEPSATSASQQEAKGRGLWGSILAVLLAATGFGIRWLSSYQSDTLLDNLAFVLYLACPFWLLFLASVLGGRIKKSEPWLAWSDLWKGPVSAVAISFAVLVVAGWLAGIVATWSLTVQWVSDPSTSKTAAQWLVVPFVAAAGIALFYIRLKLRFLYGGIEVVTSVVAAWMLVQALPAHSAVVEDPKFLLALLTAGIYLFVRGADNIHTALKAATPDPSLLAWREMLEHLRRRL